jgi:hypothetical protein
MAITVMAATAGRSERHPQVVQRVEAKPPRVAVPARDEADDDRVERDENADAVACALEEEKRVRHDEHGDIHDRARASPSDGANAPVRRPGAA